MRFSKFTPEEVERRRKESVAAMREAERAEFDLWYQEECDRLYWQNGQCCAGCDHWRSEAANVGECAAAGIVSGEDVLRSMGVTWASYTPAPGFPLTRARDHCGKFKDDFDWSTLDWPYLKKIGAVAYGVLKPKPKACAQKQKEQ
jgi:hypothetical protein